MSFAVLLALAGLLAEAKPMVVAVFDLADAQARLTPQDRAQLGRYFRAKLAEHRVFAVVPEAELKKALAQEKAESYRACFDESCQIAIGRELAAQKSLALELVSVGQQCALTATLFDLARATSERAATVKVACDAADLTSAIDQLVDKLATEGPAPEDHSAGTSLTESQGVFSFAEGQGVRLRLQTIEPERTFDVSLFDQRGAERRCPRPVSSVSDCSLTSPTVAPVELTVRVPIVGVTSETLDFDADHRTATVDLSVGRSTWAYICWIGGAAIALEGLLVGFVGATRSTSDALSSSSGFTTGSAIALGLLGAGVFWAGYWFPMTVDVDAHLLETPR